jgi:hypothetical protein
MKGTGVRIAFVAYSFSETFGVGSLRSRALARILRERGNKLELITADSLHPAARKRYWLWTIFCFAALIRSKSDIVYCSCGPFLHLPAVWLACRLARKEYVCDFRDPWSPLYSRAWRTTSLARLKGHVARLVERLVYRDCKRFWVCTPGMLAAYSALFGTDEKLELVLNGYDFEPRSATGAQEQSTRTLRIVCIGRFAYQDPIRARRVLAKLGSALAACSQPVRLDFIGTDSATVKMISAVGLEQITTFHPKMSYEQAIELAQSADLGLCLLRDERFDLGTKAYDYIGLGIPIYDSFEPDSQARRFLHDFIVKDLCQRFEIPGIEVRRGYHRRCAFEPYLSQIDGHEMTSGRPRL